MIIGRKEEQNTFKQMLGSSKAEFFAVYGRRRVGKTFLIREYFLKQSCHFFHVTGIKDGTLSQQIDRFTKEIGDTFYDKAKLAPQSNWMDVFEQLTQAIATVPKNKKIVLFFDEFPWMAVKRTKLVEALDYYWNRYWVSDKRLKLIICGSSASWIIKKILNSKGGLHNRVTGTLLLEPFSLKETQDFLKSMHITFDYKQVLSLYMVTGGIPHYLSYVKKGLSASQNIDFLCFSKNGILWHEFDNLFSSLFDNSEVHEELIKIISEYRYGIDQATLIKKSIYASNGGSFIAKLKELEEAGFIISFLPHGHKQKGLFYKVIDEYTLFYLHWIKSITDTIQKKDRTTGYWDSIQNSALWWNWAGYAFEAVCYKHIQQIRNALHISASAIAASWRYSPRKEGEQGAQIDLLFDRNDGIITLCEIKHTEQPFAIDKAYAKNLLNKMEIYKHQTKTNKQIFIALITASGMKPTMYSEELISNVVILEDLFQ